MIASLFTDLCWGHACFDFLWLTGSQWGEAYRFREVLTLNCHLSLLWRQRVVSFASATTLISVWNTRVFRTALTALTEPRTRWGRITRYPSSRRRVALHTYLLYFVVTYTHHQNDTCVTLFAGAAVMLKPFTQRLAIDDKPGSTSNHSHVFSLYSHLCIYVSI